MPSAHPIFRTIPPWDVVTAFCEHIGIGSLFPCEFHIDLLDISRYNEQMDLLQPYYHPHKASMFLLKDISNPSKQIIKILRQLLRMHDYDMKGHEVTRHNKKVILYKILKNMDVKLEEKEYAITFD
jgi:hypothetical protein